MVNYLKHQQKRQNMSRKELNREKRLVNLMHEKVCINNFQTNQILMHLYKQILSDGVDTETLDTTGKKLYKQCMKYMMYRDFGTLREMENDIYNTRVHMKRTQNNNEYFRLKNKVYEMNRINSEFRTKLLETDESRHLFNLCRNIYNLENMME